MLDEEATYPLATGSSVLFSTICCILSVTILSVILAYLNNVSIAKECILLYLYKDVVKIWIVINCLWEIRAIFCYPIEERVGIEGFEFSQKVIIFCIYSLTLTVVLLKNMICGLNIYIKKEAILDPPMPWGDNENLAVIIIRSICCASAFGFTSTMFALERYPKLYFLSIKYGTDIQLERPFASSIYAVVLMFFISTLIIIFFVEKWYRSTNKGLIDDIIPRQMNYFLWKLPFLLCFGFMQDYERKGHWAIYQLPIFIGQVLTPAFIILISNPLKSYTLKLIKYTYDEAFLLSIYLTPAFLMLIINTTLYMVYTYLDM